MTLCEVVPYYRRPSEPHQRWGIPAAANYVLGRNDPDPRLIVGGFRTIPEAHDWAKHLRELGWRAMAIGQYSRWLPDTWWAEGLEDWPLAP